MQAPTAYPPGAGHEEFSKVEILRAISDELGCRPKAPLRMSALNSAYAHLTGEFYTHPRNIGTERSPGVHRLRWAVVLEVSRQGYDMDEYIPTPEELSEGNGNPHDARPLRKEELATLATCLHETEDSRGWA